MSARIVVGLMCKAPRPGVSKTRLAAVVGAEAAAALSAAFLVDVGDMVANVCREEGATAIALFAPEDGEAEVAVLLPKTLQYRSQTGSDVSKAMQNALETLLIDVDGVVLIGADVPTAPADILRSAVRALRDPGDRMVIAPSADGGYFLIGLKRLHRRLFEDVRWSTAEVFETTLARAAEIGLDVVVLPEWHDVDDAETFEMLRNSLSYKDNSRPRGPASATRAAMIRLGFLENPIPGVTIAGHPANEGDRA